MLKTLEDELDVQPATGPLDVRDAIDQLEAIVREVAEELAGWRSRAQKAEAELKYRAVRRPVSAAPELESENKALRQRVEGRGRGCMISCSGCRSWKSRPRDNGAEMPQVTTAKKHAVRVMIGGEEYTVRSDLSPGVHARSGGLSRPGAEEGAEPGAAGGNA